LARFSQIAQKAVSVLGYWVGAKGSEVQIAGPTGTLYQNGTAITSSAAELNIMDGVLATAAEINRVADVSTRVVDVTGSTLAVTELAHDGKIITLNRAAGIAVTLPAATGSGAKIHLIVGTTVTSNTTTVKVTGNDTMVGACLQLADGGNTVGAYEVGGTDDTITLDGSTTGGIKGDSIELIDIAADLWYVRMIASATGSDAPPFSATVS